MGSKDAIKPVLESMGTVHFGKVKMKPGKPLTFATLEAEGHRALFFGLPGRRYFHPKSACNDLNDPSLRQSSEQLCLFSPLRPVRSPPTPGMEDTWTAAHRCPSGQQHPVGSQSSRIRQGYRSLERVRSCRLFSVLSLSLSSEVVFTRSPLASKSAVVC